MAAIRRLFSRIRQKFLLDPAGYGRPLDKAVLDHEYASGAWAHFGRDSELPRQVLVAGLAGQAHTHPAVLDIGCGSGRLAGLLQPFQPRRYLGVDLSTTGLVLARGLGLSGCEFIEENFETWRPSEKFDVIIFSECIGYARDPGALIAAFAPFLDRSGTIIVSHYRSGHWEALWRRVDRHVATVDHMTVANPRGQTWDIRLLRPASPAAA